MRNFLIGIVLFLPVITNADGWCQGTVARVMADNINCTDSSGDIQIAYMLGNTNNRWLCARSDAGSSLILAAKIAGKHIKAYVNAGSNCAQNDAHDYHVAQFVWVE